MTDSYGCFSAYHVALATVYPTDNYSCTFNVIPNEQRKTLRSNICLEMIRALSVTKSSQLKVTWSILWQTSKAIDGNSLT